MPASQAGRRRFDPGLPLQHDHLKTQLPNFQKLRRSVREELSCPRTIAPGVNKIQRMPYSNTDLVVRLIPASRERRRRQLVSSNCWTFAHSLLAAFYLLADFT